MRSSLANQKTKLQTLGDGEDLAFAFRRLRFWHFLTHSHHFLIHSLTLSKKRLLIVYCVPDILLLRVSFHTAKLGSICTGFLSVYQMFTERTFSRIQC